jgi:hypothetical protein
MAKSPARTVRTQSNPIFMPLYATARLEILSAQQGLSSRGTEFYYGYGRSKIMACAIMFFGVFSSGFSYLFFSN